MGLIFWEVIFLGAFFKGGFSEGGNFMGGTFIGGYFHRGQFSYVAIFWGQFFRGQFSLSHKCYANCKKKLSHINISVFTLPALRVREMLGIYIIHRFHDFCIYFLRFM